MNVGYRLIYDPQSGLWVPVCEHKTAHGKGRQAIGRLSPATWLQQAVRRCFLAGAQGLWGNWAIPRTVLVSVAMATLGMEGHLRAQVPPPIHVLPTDGVVRNGQAQIRQNGKQMTIEQSTQKAIIDWRTFDIGQNAQVHFQQPSIESSTLNRVTSNDPSRIFGQLTATGKVILTNPAGVLFGATGKVDVGGLIATTSSINPQAYLNGRLEALLDEDYGKGGSIVNQGDIRVAEKGLVALLAPEVRNEGVIRAKMGRVLLAGGDRVEMNLDGDSWSWSVSASTVHTLIANKHLIVAEGGQVVMATSAANRLLDSVINLAPNEEASGVVVKDGRVLLVGADEINVRGKIDASGGANRQGGTVLVAGGEQVKLQQADINVRGQKGGTVVVSADHIGVEGTTIDAEGALQGGRVIIGGDRLNRAAEVVPIMGNIRFAQETRIDKNSQIRVGASAGDGGFVETSGARLGMQGRVQGKATGKAGLWLIDPTDIVIDGNSTTAIEFIEPETLHRWSGFADSATVNNVSIQNALADIDVCITTNSGNINCAGNIFVNAAVAWNSDRVLTLHADNNISINANLSGTGAASGLKLFYGNASASQAALANTGYTLATGKTITLSGASASLNVGGQEVTLIHEVAQLQAMNQNLSRWYALGGDINASSCTSFNPVGGISESFYGQLHGFGHSIDQLTINQSGVDNVGLFGRIAGYFGHIRDVHLTHAVISGANYTGGLVGRIDSDSGATISHSSANVTVTGRDKVGGLAGSLGGGSLTNSSANGEVTGNASVGGLVGEAGASSNITNSNASGAVSGKQYVGGLVGKAEGSITGSTSSGNVTGDSSVGGLVGNDWFEIQPNITNSYYNLSAVYINGGHRATAYGIDGQQFGDWINGNQAPLNIGNYFTANGSAWQIASSNDLKKMLAFAMSNQSFQLTADVTPEADWFVPVFKGSFNGQNHTLAHLMLNHSAFDAVGMFGVLQGDSSVFDLRLTNADVRGKNNVGVLAGVASSGNITIRNVFASGKVTGDSSVGGLVGLSHSGDNHTIIASQASVNVIGNTSVGGLVGRSYSPSSTLNMVDSQASGNVTGSTWVGGLVGSLEGGSLINSSASGRVTAEGVDFGDRHDDPGWNGGDGVGGLVGYMFSESTINGSYATGDVVSHCAVGIGNATCNFVGGLVGNVRAGTITNSYATGNVSGNASVGGLVGGVEIGGGNIAIANSYASGNVTGTTKVGGLIGNLDNSTINNHSYYLGAQVTGESFVGGIYGCMTGNSTVDDAHFNLDSTRLIGTDPNTAGGLTRIFFQAWLANRSVGTDINQYFSSSGGFYNLSDTTDLAEMLFFVGPNHHHNFRVANNLNIASDANLSNWRIDSFDAVLEGGGKTLSNFNLTVSGGNAGFIGHLMSNGSVVNLTVAGKVTNTGAGYTGGIVGLSEGTLSASRFVGTINAEDVAGGAVGRQSGGSLTNVSAQATVSGRNFVGGLVGVAVNTTINQGLAEGAVAASGGQTLLGSYLAQTDGQVVLNEGQSNVTGASKALSVASGNATLLGHHQHLGAESLEINANAQLNLLGSINTDVVNNGTLKLDRAQGFVWSALMGNVSGSGSILAQSAGALTIDRNLQQEGNITLSGQSLHVNNAQINAGALSLVATSDLSAEQSQIVTQSGRLQLSANRLVGNSSRFVAADSAQVTLGGDWQMQNASLSAHQNVHAEIGGSLLLNDRSFLAANQSVYLTLQANDSAITLNQQSGMGRSYIFAKNPNTIHLNFSARSNIAEALYCDGQACDLSANSNQLSGFYVNDAGLSQRASAGAGLNVVFQQPAVPDLPAAVPDSLAQSVNKGIDEVQRQLTTKVESTSETLALLDALLETSPNTEEQKPVSSIVRLVMVDQKASLGQINESAEMNYLAVNRFPMLKEVVIAKKEERTRRYQEALSVLDSAPSAADIPLCAEPAVEPCMPSRPKYDATRGDAPIVNLAVQPIRRKIALVFSQGRYQDPSVPALQTTEKDAQEIKNVLAEMGYQVDWKKNSDKAEMVRAFKNLIGTVNEDDSVLVYYAGHGYESEKTKAGFWLPNDAQANKPNQWFSNNDIVRLLAMIPSRQIALISDSCYSGTLIRADQRSGIFANRQRDILDRRTVLAISSGGDEPVSDEGKEGHSIFAYHFINTLKSLPREGLANEVFDQVRAKVMQNYPQQPQIGHLKSAGAAVGGNYLFLGKP